MKKPHILFTLLFVLPIIVDCQSKLSVATSLPQIKIPETAFTLPTINITTTATQSPTNTMTPTPFPIQERPLPTVPISIENAKSLKPIKVLGHQYTSISLGFLTRLSPTFKIYATMEYPEGAGGSPSYTLRDVDNGTILHTFNEVDLGNGRVFTAFSPDGQFFAVGNEEAMLSIWDTGSGERVLQGQIENFPDLRYSRSIDSINFSPDSNLIVTTSYSGRLIGIWDLNLRRRIRTRYCPGRGACDPLAFSPDGQYFVAQGTDGINVFDGKTGSFCRRFAPNSRVITAYAFSPAGDLLAVIDRSPSLSIYEFPEGKLVALLDSDPGLDMVSAMSFSPDGKILANGHNNGSYILWDVTKLQPIYRSIGLNDPYSPNGNFALTFSPDGKMFASQSYNNLVTLWGIP